MELVILTGVQASCKTTYYHVYYATHVHVSKDLMRHHRNRQARQMEMIERSLLDGRSVVVDNTNPAVSDRAPLIAMARHCGAEVVGCYFEPCLEASLERNSGRTGRERVPDWVIRATLRRLQPPTYGEGFGYLSGALVQCGGLRGG